MMATEPTVNEIQSGIKQRLETITGLRANATEVDKPNFPCAYPRLVDWTYHDTMPGVGVVWHFDVWILVGLEPGLSHAQLGLNEYLAPRGDRSIKEAIERDPSLGGTVSDARATGGGAYGRVDIAGITALGASVRLEIFA
jgi:hypothetical protein